MNKQLVLLFSFLISIQIAFGQKQEELFSGDLTNLKFEQLVERIEQQTTYKIFYNTAWTDTLKINLVVHEKDVAFIFQQLFKDTPLRFSIDQENNIFITHTREIQTDLPVDFFDTALETASKSEFDFSEYQQEQGKKKSEETQVFAIGAKSAGLQGSATLAGYIHNKANGEPVIGASVFVEQPLIGAATDQFGFYSITLPKGKHQLKIHSLDMKPSVRQIILYADGKLNVDLSEEVISLKEVVVKSERDAKVLNLQMGTDRIDMKTLRQTPVALGEADIIKVMLTMPGVQTVGEGASGINVRGGATSQNLILLNDAIIFNPSHLFGFFSTFNPDVLKSAELFKSGMTADYGGRLSSVLDVSVREGNKKKFSGMGGISPVTGRLSLEGPIIKDKVSFLIAGRSTYSDWLLQQVDSKQLQNSKASFYDLNANVTMELSEKDNLYVSSYTSHDQFRLNSDTVFEYKNSNVGVKYKRIFNNKFYGVIGSSLSQYDFSLATNQNPINAFKFSYQIKQITSKADFNYYLNTKHHLTFGASSIHYKLNPGEISPQNPSSIITSKSIQQEQAFESALYIGDNFEMSNKLSIYGGVRYSGFNLIGARTAYSYAQGLPKEKSNILDTLYYARGKGVTHNGGFEPRLSMRYLLLGNASLKLSYNRTRQYIHMLSNTTSISPTDVWKLSDQNIKPQIGDQLSLGFYYNSPNRLFEFSAESYIKTMQNFLDFKNGAVLFMNQTIETDVISTKGRASGIEFLIKKPIGKLNGWLSYTYSRSLLLAKSPFPSETVNQGKFYPANFDKPHALNFISNYKFNQRFSFSANLTYSTGRPITLPLGKYELNGAPRLAYSERNEYRIPDYFRIDVGVNLEGNHKLKKLAHGSWSLSVYNVTGRHNAYSVYFISKEGSIKGYKLSVFAQPIPTLTYNFRF